MDCCRMKCSIILLIAHCFLPILSTLDLEYLNKHCGRSVKVFDGVHIQLTSMLEYNPNSDCSVVFYNDNNYRMMVQFLKINIQKSPNCRKGGVELFKTPHTDGEPDAVVCGTHPPNQTYVVSKNGMVARFRSGSEATFEGFDLLVTPFYTGECGEEYFQCDNKRCIADTLACNGYNNCGDRTDEKYNCGLSTQFMVAIALVSVAFFSLISVSIVVFVVRKCGRNRYNTLP